MSVSAKTITILIKYNTFGGCVMHLMNTGIFTNNMSHIFVNVTRRPILH